MSIENYPLISVIIPVYNAEKYLKRCVNSVLAQTYPNIEIILINDGSTDNSQTICEEYSRLFPSIKSLNKNNGGQSSARNVGLNSAKGEYIGFIDSDDWIAPDMYMTLYILIMNNKADGAQIDIILASDQSTIHNEQKEEIETITGRENILQYYLDAGTRRSGEYSVCRCLFPSYICKKYSFREGKVNEDIDYKYKILSECNRFVVSNKVKYYYFQSGNSTTTGILKKRDFDLFEAAGILMRLTEKENNKKIQFLGKVKYARTPFSLLCRIAYYGIDNNCGDRKTIIKKLTSNHRRNVFILLKAPLPISRKILAIALAINFKCLSLPISLIRKVR
ncbi:MAG: glycosyltransferase [Bacteroides sp.]|nr:glycosyltransferase [Bacteroides sp.]